MSSAAAWHSEPLQPTRRSAFREGSFTLGCGSTRDGRCIPFAAGEFDVALTSMTLQHLANPCAAVREIPRVLARRRASRPGAEHVYSFDPIGKLFEITAEEWTVRARGLNRDAAVRMLAAWKALASSG
jgi:hypothetical protein